MEWQKWFRSRLRRIEMDICEGWEKVKYCRVWCLICSPWNFEGFHCKYPEKEWKQETGVKTNDDESGYISVKGWDKKLCCLLCG